MHGFYCRSTVNWVCQSKFKLQLVDILFLALILFFPGEVCYAGIGPLFPVGLAGDDWRQFDAQGFAEPVSGLIFSTGKSPTCGVSLGGVGTGCLDIEAGGVLGFSSIFIPLPHRPQLLTPFLGLSGQTLAGTG